MKTLKYLSILLVLALMTSCYEDKGNYKYRDDIEDIQVKLNSLYGVKKEKEKFSYTITPEINTPDGDKSYLEYKWMMNTTSETAVDFEEIGNEESVVIEIDPNSEDFSYKYYIRLYVTDKRNGLETMRPTQLEIIKPYSYAWAVLHEQEGHAELGTVEYVGEDIFVTPDAYTKEQGKSLTGKPLNIYVAQCSTYPYYWVYEAQSKLYINTTNSEESGLLNQVEGFKLMANWNSLFYPSQSTGLNFQNMKAYPSANNGLIILCDGKSFASSYYSPCMFEMQPDVTFLGDYDFSVAIAGPHTAVGFDKKKHRFVHMALQSGDSWTGYEQTEIKNGAPLLEIAPVEGNAIDPSKIDEDIEIINSCNGYHYEVTGSAIWQKYSGYMYGIAPGNVSHVYVFRYYALTHAGVVSVPYHFEFITPEGIDKDTPMTSGYEYNNIIFYAAGNKVYKLDCSTGKSVMIYQHEDSSAQIASIKMAVEGYTSFGGSDDEGSESYGHPYTRCLGVGVNTSDGNGEFVVLQLNTAGKVDDNKKYPSIQVHKGFGKIKDIDFM